MTCNEPPCLPKVGASAAVQLENSVPLPPLLHADLVPINRTTPNSLDTPNNHSILPPPRPKDSSRTWVCRGVTHGEKPVEIG